MPVMRTNIPHYRTKFPWLHMKSLNWNSEIAVTLLAILL